MHGKVVCWSKLLTQAKANRMLRTGSKWSSGSLLTRVSLDGTKIFCLVKGKAELFSHTDIVSVHYVLIERSQSTIGTRQLGPRITLAMLVNMSCGTLIDGPALADACRSLT